MRDDFPICDCANGWIATPDGPVPCGAAVHVTRCSDVFAIGDGSGGASGEILECVLLVGHEEPHESKDGATWNPPVTTRGQILIALDGIRFDNAAIDLAWRSMPEPLHPLKKRFALAVDGVLAPRQRVERQQHRDDANCVRVDLSGVDPDESPSLMREVLADRLGDMGLWPACFLRPKPLGRSSERWLELRQVVIECVINSHPAGKSAMVAGAVAMKRVRRITPR